MLHVWYMYQFIKVQNIRFYANAYEKLCKAYETYFKCRPWTSHGVDSNCKIFWKVNNFLEKKIFYI